MTGTPLLPGTGEAVAALTYILRLMGVAFPQDPLQYPFEVPPHSYVWRAGGTETVSRSAPVNELTARRHPILAIGSNASPAQLTRKFGEERFANPASPEGCIPVLKAEVDDVDVVYGAHMAGYGALPATLLDTPGVCAHIFVTWLTSMQLDRMNETEGLGYSYQLRQMRGVRSNGDVVDAMSYVTVAGVAVLGDRPLGLVSIKAEGSLWPRGAQRHAWDLLSVDMGYGTDGKALLDRALASLAWRGRVESHLESHRLAETHAPVLAYS